MKLLHAAMYGPVHEAASKTVAAVLCSILCFPVPMGMAQEAEGGQAPTQAKHRQEYASGELQGDERILHALERFTFGPKPGDVDAVKKMGLEKWFDEQLHPATIDEADLNARLAQYPAMQWSTQDLLYRMPSNAMIRMAADGKIEIPQTGTLHAVYENQIYRFQLRKQANAEKQDNAAANQKNVAAAPAMQPGEDASDGMAPNPGEVKPALPQTNAAPPSAPSGSNQPAMDQAPAAQTGDANTMAPADANRASLRDEPDEAQIQRILALAPEDRVRRLQDMQPEDFESFIKSLRPAQRVALVADMSPDLKESVEDLEHPEQTVVQELFAERLARDIYSKAQLLEVMTDFWLNHFNIYLRKNEQMPYYLVSYERDTIRPHALGKFEDLLEAVAHSPAMMIYLDNAQSVGPDSPAAGRTKMAEARRPNAKRQDPPGINENYARELMELHTRGREWRLHASRRDPGGAGADGLGSESAAVRRRIRVQREPARAGHEKSDGREDQGWWRDGRPRAAALFGDAAGDSAVHLAPAGNPVCERRPAAGAGGPHGEGVHGKRRRYSDGAEDAVPLAGVLGHERLPRQGEDAD